MGYDAYEHDDRDELWDEEGKARGLRARSLRDDVGDRDPWKEEARSLTAYAAGMESIDRRGIDQRIEILMARSEQADTLTACLERHGEERTK